jgi:hypothetical protein
MAVPTIETDASKAMAQAAAVGLSNERRGVGGDDGELGTITHTPHTTRATRRRGTI